MFMEEHKRTKYILPVNGNMNLLKPELYCYEIHEGFTLNLGSLCYLQREVTGNQTHPIYKVDKSSLCKERKNVTTQRK